ncbi:MAG: hypothetical protein HZC42_06655 [Candidatus Eisenbacteria bacterium]|nr:hypothetical protein [Candidatus Eisenbacteria bacterium]
MKRRGPGARPATDPRRCLARALARCAVRERLLLALVLFERLTLAEAADVLGVPVRRVHRLYARLLSDLRDALAGRRAPAAGGSRAAGSRPAAPAARLRRAS